MGIDDIIRDGRDIWATASMSSLPADWRAGRNAVYQLAALTIGARLAVADA
jgi:hypothetical protein